MKPTKKLIAGLQWFSEREAVALFDAAAPSRAIRKRLEAYGFVKPVGKEPRTFGFVKYALTDEGRAMLAKEKTER